MKDVLSLVTFVLAALCFVVFVTTVKPDAMSAVAQPQSRRLAKRLHRGRAGAACTSLQQRQKPLSGTGNDRSRHRGSLKIPRHSNARPKHVLGPQAP